MLRGFVHWFAPLGIPLAWRQLTAQGKRLAAAVAGVGFGSMLMLFQLGLYNGIMSMVVLPHNQLRGDLVLVSPNFEYFGSGMEFSRRRLYQTLALPEVEAAMPLYFGFLRWRNPETGRTKMIFGMAIDPDQNPFTEPEITANLAVIRDSESVLFDTRSHKDYGPITKLFRERGPVETESDKKRVYVKGLFTLGHTLAASANVVLSDEAFLRIRTDRPRNMPNAGLICLKKGTDAQAVAKRLRAMLPNDVEVITRDEFIRREQEYWAKRTPIGFISGAGMVVGLFVGAIVVYQILYTDVNDHLKEYATLKAMGFRDSFFIGMILQEALILTLIGFIPATLLTELLNYAARESAQIPVSVSLAGAAAVFLAVMVISLVAGLLATRRLRSADPADVF